MTLKKRIKKMEAGLRKQGKIPPAERVCIFFDDGSGSVRAEMENQKALLMKKYNSSGGELLQIQSCVPEPRPRPE